MSAIIDPAAIPSGTGCVECDAAGGWWVHLRRCAGCGHIGCCDDSLGRHATAHWRESGHPIIQSFEPGEDWFWDFDSDAYYAPVAGAELLAPPDSRPADETVPGPRGRVPSDWSEQLQRRGG